MDRLLEFATEIVASYVSSNEIAPDQLPGLISSIFASLSGLGQGVPPETAPAPSRKRTPAEIKRSITPGALISFIDGRPYKMLKRHLNANGLSFAQYRSVFGLPDSYPSTCEEYSKRRSDLAVANGLGLLSRNRQPEQIDPIPAPMLDLTEALGLAQWAATD